MKAYAFTINDSVDYGLQSIFLSLHAKAIPVSNSTTAEDISLRSSETLVLAYVTSMPGFGTHFEAFKNVDAAVQAGYSLPACLTNVIGNREPEVLIIPLLDTPIPDRTSFMYSLGSWHIIPWFSVSSGCDHREQYALPG